MALLIQLHRPVWVIWEREASFLPTVVKSTQRCLTFTRLGSWTHHQGQWVAKVAQQCQEGPPNHNSLAIEGRFVYIRAKAKRRSRNQKTHIKKLSTWFKIVFLIDSWKTSNQERLHRKKAILVKTPHSNKLVWNLKWEILRQKAKQKTCKQLMT